MPPAVSVRVSRCIVPFGRASFSAVCRAELSSLPHDVILGPPILSLPIMVSAWLRLKVERGRGVRTTRAHGNIALLTAAESHSLWLSHTRKAALG